MFFYRLAAVQIVIALIVKNGRFTRKGLHSKASSSCFQIVIKRYLCTNPLCWRATFSVLPQKVLRYCRFFWPCLLAVWDSLVTTPPAIIAHKWNVGCGVIERAKALQTTIVHGCQNNIRRSAITAKSTLLPVWLSISLSKQVLQILRTGGTGIIIRQGMS
jgi:hypothetical protein